MATKDNTGGKAFRQGKGGATSGQSDDPRQAMESGEPSVTGRSHGRAVESTGSRGTGSGAGKKTGGGARGNTGKVGEDLESGRQGTK